MSAIAVRVQGLGKEYRIGERLRYKTLRDSLMGVARAPLRFFRRRIGNGGYGGSGSGRCGA